MASCHMLSTLRMTWSQCIRKDVMIMDVDVAEVLDRVA